MVIRRLELVTSIFVKACERMLQRLQQLLSGWKNALDSVNWIHVGACIQAT